MTGTRRVAVIGGGIAGLSAAHRLDELAEARGRALQVVLFEASKRLGGPIRSLERDGFLLEEGPDSLLLEKPAARGLIERLGLGERLVPVRPEARRSLVVRDGRLLPFPAGFQLVAPASLLGLLASPLLGWRGKLRAAREPFVPPRAEESDESVASFVERRFGRELYEAIAEPLVSGIYGADPRDLSARVTLGRFVQWERAHGSVVAGLRAARRIAGERGAARGARYALFASFDRGMETLVSALAAPRVRVEVRLGAAVRHLGRAANGRWRVAAGEPSSGGADEAFDAVLLAAPAYALAPLFAAWEADLSAALHAIPYRSSATLQLAYAEGAVPDLRASGFVVPRCHGGLLRGATLSHLKYEGRAPRGHALVRLYFAGDTPTLDEARLLAEGRLALERLTGVRAEPLFTHTKRQDRAAPHYRVGHLDLVERMRAACRRLGGLFPAGSAWDGAGLPDVIEGAERAAEAIFEGEARG